MLTADVGDVARGIHGVFYRHLNSNPGLPSVFSLSGVNFVYFLRHDVYFVLATKSFSSPAFLMEVLYRSSSLIRDYIGELSERAIRRNFALVYEILDEIVDTGLLQDFSTEVLKPFILNNPQTITVDATTSKSVSAVAANQSVATAKKRNELFIDVIERIALSFSSNGSLHFAELTGSVKLRSFVNGCPRLAVQFSNVPRRAENLWFPQFVNSSEFSSNSLLNFNTPEGESVLMRYSIKDSNFRSPLRVFVFVDEQDSHRIDVVLRLRADFNENVSAANIKLILPVPAQTIAVSFNFDSQFGHMGEFSKADGAVYWTLEKLTGGFEKSVKLTLTFDHNITPCTRHEIGPVNVDFEIPAYSASGMSLKSVKPSDGTNLQKWVRLVTQSSSVQVIV
ncbi:hypothetical protein RCL1_002410 [Eukaryota sp. TZLM3-RCL]